MRKILILIVAAAVTTACGETSRPIEDALQKKVLGDNPDLLSYKVEKVKTEFAVKLTDELSRRETLYESQVNYCEKEIEKYRKKRMPYNMAKHRKRLEYARVILNDLHQYREIYAERMDSVIYYVVSFTGSGTIRDGRQVREQEMKAAVGADCRVFRIVTANDNIYRGMGQAIPAYEYILLKNTRPTKTDYQ